jgi:ribosome biogenesis protein Nip4
MTTLAQFCSEFGIAEQDLGPIMRLGRRCFLTDGSPFVERFADRLFGAGVYLGEEKQRFEPSAALLELIAAKTPGHKAVVDEKSAWLFLCGRDVFTQGILKRGEPTPSGFLLIQNELDENLGYGIVAAKKPELKKNGRVKERRPSSVAIKNLLDRGHFLRRERLE